MTDQQAQTPDNEAALNLAYGFVLPSYDWARDRLDKMNARLQAMQSVVVGVTIAVPAFMRSVLGDKVAFDSKLFVASMVAFGLAVIVGLIAQTWGTLTLANPRVFHDHYLTFDEWTFKRKTLEYAGKHTDKNLDTVLYKGHALSTVTLLFLVGVGLLVAWIATSSGGSS